MLSVLSPFCNVDAGKALSMLGRVQLELQKLVDGYVGTFLFCMGWGAWVDREAPRDLLLLFLKNQL